MEFISGTSRCNHIQRVGNLHAHTNLQAILISAAAQGCLTRVKQIAAFTVDRRFENSFDAALAAYLHCLRATHPDLAFIGATVSQKSSNKFKMLFGGNGGPHNRD